MIDMKSSDIKLKRTKHIQPKKGVLRVKSKKTKMSITFKKGQEMQENQRRLKKMVKKREVWISLVMQIISERDGSGKIPSSSVRSLSLKSSVCFFVRGPIGPRRRKWRKTG